METRQRTQPVSNSVVGSAKATVPRAFMPAKPRGPPASDAATAGIRSPGSAQKGAAEAPTSTAPQRTPDPSRVHVRVTASNPTRLVRACLALIPVIRTFQTAGIMVSARVGVPHPSWQLPGVRHMSVPAPQPQDTATIVAIVLVVAAICARYWRTVLLMIMISLPIFTALGLI